MPELSRFRYCRVQQRIPLRQREQPTTQELRSMQALLRKKQEQPTM